ncbi:hypothetical protein ACFLRF_05070 [Candidatus Altiarchaeota archaeon]
MDFKVIEKKKDSLELEFDEKEIPLLIVHELTKNGIDAYFYDPHPLLHGFRVHIDADDPMKEFKKAVDELSKDWSLFKKELEAKLK